MRNRTISLTNVGFLTNLLRVAHCSLCGMLGTLQHGSHMSSSELRLATEPSKAVF